MADRAVTLGAGVLAAALLALLLGPLAALGLSLEDLALTGPELSALRFTVWQAFLSALISVALAVPVARALARRQFVGRGALISLLGAPFILPVIVAVLGLLAVFGRVGWLNTGLGALGLPTMSVYGLQGVVLAHVFFNMPLAVRLILQGWVAIPSERFRLAARLPPRRHCPPYRTPDAARGVAGRRPGDLCDQPHELCRGADPGRRAARHNA